jgi:hypothetical protein
VSKDQHINKAQRRELERLREVEVDGSRAHLAEVADRIGKRYPQDRDVQMVAQALKAIAILGGQP